MITLGEVADRGADTLTLACELCGHQDQLSVARLIKQRGKQAALVSIAGEMTTDCPRRGSPGTRLWCGAHWKGLAVLFGVGED